jgi:hypothetical protein
VNPERLHDFHPNEVGPAQLQEAIQSRAAIKGLTHQFYRYPARFSPAFVRSAIETYTQPGDLVLDPFMGGGTTVVEALASGRRVVGSDVNTLAGFISRVKSTPLSRHDHKVLREWSAGLGSRINYRHCEPPAGDWERYQRNIPWRIRKTLALISKTVDSIRLPRARAFAKATLLRTAQWALDCRRDIPSHREILVRHAGDVAEMLDGAAAFGEAVRNAFGNTGYALRDSRRLLVRSTAGLDQDKRIPKAWGPPRLIVTSPPYVGVHILYHRWQVRGRRETAAPYWLAACHDGRPNAFYNFADRRHVGMERYLKAMRESFGSVAAMMDSQSTLVQLVAFAKPEWQLPLYLDALESLKLSQVEAPGFDGSTIACRSVPNRKWYASNMGAIGASKEFLLVHRRMP